MRYVDAGGARLSVIGLGTWQFGSTEWGYGGGKFVDRNCRWCDQPIKVPKQEEAVPHPALDELADGMGFNDNQ